ncbi:MAG: hypothetical protein AVDCRST_MAG04-773, partial [uncultured Acetobacteraceae bacterium]
WISATSGRGWTWSARTASTWARWTTWTATASSSGATTRRPRASTTGWRRRRSLPWTATRCALRCPPAKRGRFGKAKRLPRKGG